MANVLDIRRRIRSVVNTRQITKAMKTVSAAKLRRAQEGALAARPYSQMLTNVLKSLVSRADVYDPVTGQPIHPLLAERPEKNHPADRGYRRQGTGGRVQYQYSEDGLEVHRVQARTEYRRRMHRTQRAATSCAAAIRSPQREQFLPMERRAPRPCSRAQKPH